jgi:uncharacterized protein YcnI
MLKKLLFSLMTGLAVFLIPAVAMAHVAVQPNEVGIGKTQVFSISVPTEKEVPTVSVRLVLPSGLQEVKPTVKAGWQIDAKTTGEGDKREVSEIIWTAGSIPAEQRDEFSFSAQVPASATTLQWKAYQTYQDGSVVSWDQTPTGSDDATGDKGPYSTTKVINDLTTTTSTSATKTNLVGPYAVAGIAAVLAIAGLLMKKK